MSFLTFCVLAGLFGILLLGTLLENYNQHAYQRDMDRRFDEHMAKYLDPATGDWKPDTTPTDWVYLAGLGPKGGRAKDGY